MSLRERVAPVTPPVVETQRNNEYDEADEQQLNCIFRLQDDLLHEVIRRVTPTELCRMVAASRDIHRLLNRATKIEVPIPFLGALVLRGRTYDVVSLMNRRMLRGIQRSVSYLRGKPSIAIFLIAMLPVLALTLFQLTCLLKRFSLFLYKAYNRVYNLHIRLGLPVTSAFSSKEKGK